MNDNGERQKFQRDYRANARVLRGLRNRAHLSLKALAAKSGVNYTTINRIEKGHNRSPQWPTLEQLADALNVQVDDLVIYEDFDETLKTQTNREKIEETEEDWDKEDEELEEEAREQGE